MTTTTATPASAGRPDTARRSGRRRLRLRRGPWRHPWFLEGFTWLYLIWSLVPVGIAVLFSFNNGQSQSVWQGFSWRWYFADPVNSVLHDPNLQIYHAEWNNTDDTNRDGLIALNKKTGELRTLVAINPP